MTKTTDEIIKLKPHHWGVNIPDLEASIAWYREKLGFFLERRGTIEAAHARIAFLKHGEFSLELFEVEGAAPLPQDRRFPNQDLATHGTKHMAFAVKDRDKVMERLKKRGVDIASEGRPSFIRDNAGNLIELMQL